MLHGKGIPALLVLGLLAFLLGAVQPRAAGEASVRDQEGMPVDDCYFNDLGGILNCPPKGRYDDFPIAAPGTLLQAGKTRDIGFEPQSPTWWRCKAEYLDFYEKGKCVQLASGPSYTTTDSDIGKLVQLGVPRTRGNAEARGCGGMLGREYCAPGNRFVSADNVSITTPKIGQLRAGFPLVITSPATQSPSWTSFSQLPDRSYLEPVEYSLFLFERGEPYETVNSCRDENGIGGGSLNVFTGASVSDSVAGKEVALAPCFSIPKEAGGRKGFIKACSASMWLSKGRNGWVCARTPTERIRKEPCWKTLTCPGRPTRYGVSVQLWVDSITARVAVNRNPLQATIFPHLSGRVKAVLTAPERTARLYGFGRKKTTIASWSGSVKDGVRESFRLVPKGSVKRALIRSQSLDGPYRRDAFLGTLEMKVIE